MRFLNGQLSSSLIDGNGGCSGFDGLLSCAFRLLLRVFVGDLRWVEFGQENSASEIDWKAVDGQTVQCDVRILRTVG